MSNAETVTDSQIRLLCSEARIHDDNAMVAICIVALGTGIVLDKLV